MDDDDDGWVFDTVKPQTTKTARSEPAVISESIYQDEDEDEEMDEPMEMMEDLRLSSPTPSKHSRISTVRRTPGMDDRSPSIRHTARRRRTSSVKQPLALDLSFGNSPSGVRQFHRVPYKAQTGSSHSASPAITDENASPNELHSEPKTKESQLGKRAYGKAVGLACQEVLDTTGEQDKRESISRLAEAWSDLEMVDPEGLYHIIRAMNGKLQRYLS